MCQSCSTPSTCVIGSAKEASLLMFCACQCGMAVAKIQLPCSGTCPFVHCTQYLNIKHTLEITPKQEANGGDFSIYQIGVKYGTCISQDLVKLFLEFHLMEA